MMNPEPAHEQHLPESNRGFPLGVAAGVYLVLLGVAAAWSWFRGDRPLLALEVAGSGYALALGGGCGAVAALVAAWAGGRLSWARELERTLARLLGRLTPTEALLLALLSSTVEEALFRGALQPSLGLIPTSVLFGLAHLAPLPGLRPWVVVATVMGLVLGWLFEHSGSLLAPIACHLVVNVVGLWRLAVARGEPEVR